MPAARSVMTARGDGRGNDRKPLHSQGLEIRHDSGGGNCHMGALHAVNG